MRSRHVDVLWTLAIVATVMAGLYQPRFLFYPARAFHLALLFFVAGFATTGFDGTDRLRTIAREARTHLGTLYGHTALFAIATVLLAAIGFAPKGSVPTFESGAAIATTLRQFVLAPITGEGPYGLFLAGWVLFQLFVAGALVKLLDTQSAPALGPLGGLAIATVLLAQGSAGALSPELQVLAVRTGWALLFFQGGRIVASSDRVGAALLSPWVLPVGFVLVDLLGTSYGDLSWAVEDGALGNAPPFVRVLTGAAIVAMAFQVAHFLAQVLGERSLVWWIGRSWQRILIWSGAVVVAVDVAFGGAAGLLRDVTPTTRGTHLNHTWLLYLVPAVVLPIVGEALWARLRGRSMPAPMAAAVTLAAPTRSRHVDVMLAVGIVYVVMGHRVEPPNLTFPAYTFHMALFFFVSGYLATIKPDVVGKVRFLAHKTRTQLVRYFQYNLFFAVVTWALALGGVRLGYNVPSFESRATALEAVRAFFVVPFLDGHQYHLYLAAWFILQLYLVHVIFQIVCWRADRRLVLSVLVVAIPITLVLLQDGLQDYTDARLTGVRTAFAFLFFLVGYVVKTGEATLRRWLLAPAALVLAFALVNVLAVNFGNIRYNLVLGNVNNERVWVPLLATLLIVLMVFQVTHHVARLVGDRSPIVVLGRSTLDIMIWHFTVFLAINAGLFAAGLITKENLSDNWFVWEGSRTWLLYEVPALVLPIFLGRGLRQVAARLTWRRGETQPPNGAAGGVNVVV